VLQHLVLQLAAASVLVAGAPGALAQTPPPATPTTRILAIGTFAPATDMQLVQRTLAAEARATAELYLEGKIDQWYSLENRPGGGVHRERHRHRCGTGHAGSAAPGQGAPDDLRTLSDRAVETAAPVIEIARGPLAPGYMSTRVDVNFCQSVRKGIVFS
jgi:hypothetical protein